MSGAHKLLIEQAVRDGAQIDGFAVSKTAPVTPTAPVRVEKVNASATVADIPDPSRDECSWEAYAKVDGKIHPIGMRTVCNGCSSSLTYCYCRTPIVTVDSDTRVLVNFKPRKNPLPARMW